MESTEFVLSTPDEDNAVVKALCSHMLASAELDEAYCKRITGGIDKAIEQSFAEVTEHLSEITLGERVHLREALVYCVNNAVQHTLEQVVSMEESRGVPKHCAPAQFAIEAVDEAFCNQTDIIAKLWDEVNT
jgi:hypothetical protein